VDLDSKRLWGENTFEDEGGGEGSLKKEMRFVNKMVGTLSHRLNALIKQAAKHSSSPRCLLFSCLVSANLAT
jgi:hypothetical protein